jgi:hypothetical protein
MPVALNSIWCRAAYALPRRLAQRGARLIGRQVGGTVFYVEFFCMHAPTGVTAEAEAR